MNKVLCINDEGWEEEETRIKTTGPEFEKEYTVLESEGDFYALMEFPGCLFEKSEFAPCVEYTEAEERVMSKVFSH